MNYESIDWQAEALRVAAAFDVAGACEFCIVPADDWWDDASVVTMQLVRSSGKAPRIVETSNGFELQVEYSPESRSFGLVRSTTGISCLIDIGWDGSPVKPFHESTLKSFLARPLFHLELLTPEVEAVLGVSPSVQQKMEWMVEYRK